jgi:hypothetical protein
MASRSRWFRPEPLPSIALRRLTTYHALDLRSRSTKGKSMKKLLIILILAAIGIAVAKKVREA